MTEKESKFKVGDKVKIVLEGWKDKYPKIYTIKKVLFSSQGYYVYKLNGVPAWGREEHIKAV